MEPTTLDLAAQAPSPMSLSILLFFLAIAVLNVTELLKLAAKAFTPKNWPPQPDPWWWQFLWRLVPLLLGGTFGAICELSAFFAFPWGVGAGVVAATFMTTIYNKGRSVIEGLRLRGIDSDANAD